MFIRFIEVWGADAPQDREYCCVLIKDGQIVAGGTSKLRSKALNKAKKEYRFTAS